MTSFSNFGFDAQLLRGVTDLGFTEATPIQRDAIPPALAGRDLLACAMTGSGKTAAFVLPVLARLLGKPRGTTRALVLSPTREIAAQTAEHAESLARYTGLTVASVYGGVPARPQESAFRRGVDIIVATPGRLLDHMKMPYASFAGLEILVLDEADRMLDMGFLPDIRRVLRQLPTKRQTLFFSATMPPQIGQLAKDMLKTPAMLNVERQSAPADGVTQTLYRVLGDKKSALLLSLWKQGDMDTVLAFTRTKHRADRLHAFLQRAGVPVARIHGNRSQSQRELALDGFRDGTFRVLVATDIAARGIDVEALSHVVNFDVPHVAEDYIHRVGRTARASLTGQALTFVSPEEEPTMRQIEKHLGRTLPRAEAPGFEAPPSRSGMAAPLRSAPSQSTRPAARPSPAVTVRSFRPRW